MCVFCPENRLCSPPPPPTPNVSSQVLNKPKKTCECGFSCSASRLLPAPTTPKPLIWKASDSRILTDHAQQFHCEPPGFTERFAPQLSVFVFSIWAADRAWEGQGRFLRAGHMLDFGGQCAQGVLKHSARVTPGGRAASVLSGGLLLECWLPSNKILLLSNSNS